MRAFRAAQRAAGSDALAPPPDDREEADEGLDLHGLVCEVGLYYHESQAAVLAWGWRRFWFAVAYMSRRERRRRAEEKRQMARMKAGQHDGGAHAPFAPSPRAMGEGGLFA